MTPAPDKSPSAQVMRALALLELLCDALPNGLSNKELAGALQVPPSYVTRTVETLIEKGWAERTEGGRFRVTARFSQLTFRVLRSFDKATGHLDDLRRNYSLGA